MNKKSYILVVILLITILTLSSCRSDSYWTTDSNDSSGLTGKMKIHASNLSKDEKDILSLTQMEGEYGIFDYKADKTLTGIEIKLLEYKDNEWEEITSAESSVMDGDGVSGRFLVTYDDVTGLLRTSWDSGASMEYEDEEITKVKDGATARAWLSDGSEDIVYGKEIPLGIIVKSDPETEGLSVSMEGFENPKLLRGASTMRAVVAVFKDTSLDDSEADS